MDRGSLSVSSGVESTSKSKVLDELDHLAQFPESSGKENLGRPRTRLEGEQVLPQRNVWVLSQT